MSVIRFARIIEKPKRPVKVLLSVLLILALLDLIATIIWVDGKMAIEANPVMDYFLQKSPVLFALTKLLLTFVGVFILNNFKFRRNKLIYRSSVFLVAVYSVLTCWHIGGIVRTLF